MNANFKNKGKKMLTFFEYDVIKVGGKNVQLLKQLSVLALVE